MRKWIVDEAAAKAMLAGIWVILKDGNVCPECQVPVDESGQHGLSQTWPGDACHRGALLPASTWQWYAEEGKTRLCQQ